MGYGAARGCTGQTDRVLIFCGLRVCVAAVVVLVVGGQVDSLMAENEELTLTCQFCNTAYQVSPTEIAQHTPAADATQ